MSFFNSFDISASGMTAQRFRTDIISQNIANATTTRTEDGTPYKRQVVTFAEKSNMPFSEVLAGATSAYNGSGVKVTSVKSDDVTPMKLVYDPSHPDANADGYVEYPNVNIVTEMTNLIDASRSYEANTTAFEASKSMASQGLNIGK